MSATEGSTNLQNAASVCDLLDRAATINLNLENRRGATVHLEAEYHLTISGDLHDHRENFNRLLKLTRLPADDSHHLLIQETIHGDHRINGMDFSYRILCMIAELTVRHPGQVHHLLSNHELAQINGEEITKDGLVVVSAFDDALDYVFADEMDQVIGALNRYVRSLPLAVRTAGGVLCTHALPSARKAEVFDKTVLDRDLEDSDYRSPDGSAYLLVWGRSITDAWEAELAEAWEVNSFVIGHEPAEMGWETHGERMLILNSDHTHGVALPIHTGIPYRRDELIDLILPLNAVL